MKRREAVAATVGALLSGAAGCFTPEGEEAYIEFTGSINDTSDGNRLDGYIYATSSTERDTYRDVSIIFYDENRDVIKRDELGSLPGGQGELFFNYSIPADARTIAFDSDDFWKENMVVYYFCYDAEEGEWGQARTASRDGMTC